MSLIKFEGFRLTEKGKIVFLVFNASASKLSCEQQRGFSDKYMANQTLYLQLSSRDLIFQIWSINSLMINWYFKFVIHENLNVLRCKLWREW